MGSEICDCEVGGFHGYARGCWFVFSVDELPADGILKERFEESAGK